MIDSPPETIHATTVAIAGHAVAICGASGRGKSDLALRLIDRGAILVADDRTVLRRDGDRLLASAPATIAGKMEVRGVGIVTLPASDPVPLALIVHIGEEERMPDERARMIDGIEVALVTIAASAPSAPIKVELALGQVLACPR